MDRDEDESEFFSSSFLIRREQHLLNEQLGLVVAAAELFQELRARFDELGLDQRDWSAERDRMTVAAKAFVYEAVTLRLVAVDIARRFPQFANDTDRGLKAFDTAFPQLVELRNSQAHFDERINFRARAKRITPTSFQGEAPFPVGSLLAPPQVCGSTIQGTTETGGHAVIEISDRTVKAAERLVVSVFASVVSANRRSR